MAKKPAQGKAKKSDGKKTTESAAKPVSTAKSGAVAKSARPRGLGRGLSSLLGDAGVVAATSSTAGAETMDAKPAAVASGLQEIPVEWINSGPWQPRRRFDKQALAELAESIRSKGLVQPILVRPQAGSANRFELIAGERRWRAAQMAQLHAVPAIVRAFSDEEAYEVALIENVQRSDLSVIEEAEGYRQLIENFGYKQEQLAEMIGKSRSHIANLMRLLSLPSEVTDMLIDGRMSMGQARPLIGNDDAVTLAREIVQKGLNARQAEALAARPKAEKAGSKPATNSKPADITAMEQRAQKTLGLKVGIDWDEAKDRGKMTLTFSRLEQFEDVMKRLGVD